MAMASGIIVFCTQSCSFWARVMMSSSFSTLGTKVVPPGTELMMWGILPPTSAAISSAVACMSMASM